MRLLETTSELNEELAVRLLGWKWLSFMTRPSKSHPEYYIGKNIRCRRLFSPEELNSERWNDVFAERDARDATGDEPLAYAYCSSNGPACPPKFHILVEE